MADLRVIWGLESTGTPEPVTLRVTGPVASVRWRTADFDCRRHDCRQPRSGKVPGAVHLDWSSLFGRLHPLVVHFPLALILVAALVEAAGWLRHRPPSIEVLQWLLGPGAVAAAAAAATGWWFARQQENADEGLLRWHRWLGLAVAALALGLWLSLRWPALARHRRWLLLVAAGLTALCGHLGGMLVWHDDFFN